MSTISPPTRLGPQQRLERLCDARTLENFPANASRPNVFAARGLVDGRPIVCYAQDSTMAGGSVGIHEAELIVSVLRHSRLEGVPVVTFLESAGARLQDGAGALAGFGRIFSENVALSGWAPQISVITGTAAGGGCYSPALTDFVVMEDSASMFLTGPKIVKHALGEDVTSSELGGVGIHQHNGVCDFVVADDLAAIALARELLGYLPQNASERPCLTGPEPPPDDADPSAALPERSRSFYDVRDVIRRLVDAGRFLEVSPRWARNMVIGFARLNGHPIAIIANQARHLGGIIDVEGSQKGAKFVRTCAFGLPLLVLVDTPGFMPGRRQEGAGVIRYGAELVRAFAAARAPRATVILRKAFGGAFIAMNSKDLGADASFSWPDAEIGIMSAGAAVEIIHHRQLHAASSDGLEARRLIRRYADEHVSAQAAVRRGAIDAVIEPGQTRERVAAVLVGRRPSDRRRFEWNQDGGSEVRRAVWAAGIRSETAAAVSERAVTLTRLEQLEAESIHIMREAVSEAEKPVMLYSIGKDSSVMLHLALRAFHPAKPPFPLLHVDTRWKFRDMYEFRDRTAAELGLELLVHTNEDGVAKNINPFDHGPEVHTHVMKTVALRQALDRYGFDAAFGGARRDEEKSRAKERIFSVRSAQHAWNPKRQRPEMWRTYNARVARGESLRVFPLSNWTELDVWRYIELRGIPVVPLYFAARRPVVERQGALIMVDDERLPLRSGEQPMWRRVRFRTLGCYPLTGAIESEADTLPAIISEMLHATTSERQGRVIDHDSAASIERKKQEGYF